MNDNLDPTNDDLAKSLQQKFRLSTPADVKADLLYRCGIAAGESKFQNRNRKNSWITAAAIVLAFSIGGLGGRFSNQPAGQDGIAKSSDTEVTTNNEVKSAEVHSSAINSPRPFVKRQKNALTAAMDLNQARRALSQTQPVVGISQTVDETSSTPLSVGMSKSDLDLLLSL